jgi:hypothetical protein
MSEANYFFLFFFCEIGVGTQGFVLAKQGAVPLEPYLYSS